MGTRTRVATAGESGGSGGNLAEHIIHNARKSPWRREGGPALLSCGQVTVPLATPPTRSTRYGCLSAQPAARRDRYGSADCAIQMCLRHHRAAQPRGLCRQCAGM